MNLHSKVQTEREKIINKIVTEYDVCYHKYAGFHRLHNRDCTNPLPMIYDNTNAWIDAYKTGTINR